MNFKTRVFAILWIAGMAGLLSFLLVDLSAFLANLPVAAEAKMPFSPLLVKLLSIIQTTILMSVAVFVGLALASSVGLSSPAAEAAAGKGNIASAFKPQSCAWKIILCRVKNVMWFSGNYCFTVSRAAGTLSAGLWWRMPG